MRLERRWRAGAAGAALVGGLIGGHGSLSWRAGVLFVALAGLMLWGMRVVPHETRPQ